MKQKYKKILSLLGLSFFVANLVFISAMPVLTFAQNPTGTTPPPATSAATPSVPPGVGEQSIANYLCIPGTGIYTCVNKLYRVALAVAFFITVLFIVFAGYQYMLGGEKGKEDAKGRISAAIVAIIILSTSYILLRQINPDLVEFKSISPLPVDLATKLDPLDDDRGSDIPDLDDPDGGNPAPGSGGGTSKDHEDTSCAKAATNCTDLKPLGYDCKNNCKVQNILADKLYALKARSNPPFWRITEAYPPTVKHSDACHATGACVDMGIQGSSTFDQLCGAINQIPGLGIWNETGKTSQACGQDHTSGATTGGHLHVYLTQ